MPLPMVHLSIARNVLMSGFKIKHTPYFYLGAISPDAIHIRNNTERSDKSNTHLIPVGKKWKDIDENEYTIFIIDFINKNKTKTNADFLWGYGMHILTDMYWTKEIYYNFTEDYKLDVCPIQKEQEAYYNDTDILDQDLYNDCSWKHDVWHDLQGVEYFDFLDLLSAHEIKLWNERTLHWYDSGESQHKNPVKYIMKSDIIGFISSCSKKLLHISCE